MSQRVFVFVVVLNLTLIGEIFSQENKALPGCNTPYFPAFYGNMAKKKFFLPNCNESITGNWLRIKPITPDFYINNLSFICKKEIQLEKTTSIPFRFRLGSLNYVNYLEQKPNSPQNVLNR